MRAEIDAIRKVSDVYGRHRAIAGEVFWRFSINLLHYWARNLHRLSSRFRFYRVGAIVT